MRSFSHRMSFSGVVYSASIFEALSPTSCEGNFFLVSCVCLKFFVWPTNQAIFFASTPFLNLAPAASWFSDTGKIAATCRVYPFIYLPLAHLPICIILSQGKKIGDFHLRESGRIAFVRQMKWWIGVHAAMHTVEGSFESCMYGCGRHAIYTAPALYTQTSLTVACLFSSHIRLPFVTVLLRGN